ncbi:tyrosine-type recombinase/integrase [Aquimarina sp. ERC-38]|uniref:tyrosine-type recombinase/integrase n=1 Tax=Aquimarina sp. ERC-38 TaxID=2949996 RepID=UPI0022469481|nr:tyrosine-type recombinase/integrase [Aquimarina sp. ERC-38]UZO80650.1 tyrosine-type recombinase/integrase [Aquimarina sp. ERC-38]UZO80664.1 tyrosine-type recombinase/integrase [Aquimarina sp. ERC-38]
MHQNFKGTLASYRSYLTTLCHAGSSVYDYTRFVHYFFTYLQKETGLNEITQLKEKHVWGYYKHLKSATGVRTKRAFSNAHLNRNFLAIDKLLECLHALGMEDAPVPLNYSVENIPLKEISVLSQQEIKHLYGAISDTFSYRFYGIRREARQKTLELVLNLCYGCGLRRSEALHLKEKDIDLDRGVLHVRQGKNYKDRFVPISKNLVRSFTEYIYDYRRHLPGRRTSYLYPFGATAIGQVLPLLQKTLDDSPLKNKNISLHTLRHSIATHLLDNGMPIEQISQFLGHSGLTSTQIYTHIINRD